MPNFLLQSKISSTFIFKIISTYIIDLMNKALILSLLVLFVVGQKILVVLDNKVLENTHSQFLQLLKEGDKNQVQIAYSFGRNNIQLKYYDRFRYNHVVLMCTSDRDTDSKIKTRDIISYFDEGGNVIVIADIDTSISYRKLFNSFGLELDDQGTLLKDHFSNHEDSTIISTRNYDIIAPFFSGEHHKQPLLYKGLGMSLVNYENYQLFNLVQAEHTTFSKNYNTGQAIKAGTTISLVTGVQGLNNARALLVGSLYFFSNQALQEEHFGNKNVVVDLIKWTFRETGVIRVKSMTYHGEGVGHKETLFNVGQKLYFSAEVEEQNSETGFWKPYVASDLQVELVMLDPWVRTTLVKGQGNSYHAEFYAPLKEGIYQFKIIYKKAGYTYIKHAERVTIRPYKHDEFERFLFVAYPYTFGTFATIISTFIFVVLYIYSGRVQKSKED